jgi:zinc protease
VGASLGFGASVHNTGFGGRCLVEDLPLLFSLFSEALRFPAFPEDQVERLRDQIMASLAIRAQDTWDMASMAFDEVLFAGHPYARPDDGNPDTIQAITVDDLRGFQKRHFGPQGMVVVVVGGISASEAVDRVQQAVGDWENPEQIMAPPFPQLRKLDEPCGNISRWQEKARPISSWGRVLQSADLRNTWLLRWAIIFLVSLA